MPTRDNAIAKKVVSHIDATAHTATQTPTNGVDTQGFDSLTFIIAIGALANAANSPQPTWAFKAQESDTINSGFVDITDSERVITTGAKSPVVAPDSSTGVFFTAGAVDGTVDTNAYHVGIISAMRYVRIVATAANTPGATPFAVVAVLERASKTPVVN